MIRPDFTRQIKFLTPLDSICRPS